MKKIDRPVRRRKVELDTQLIEAAREVIKEVGFNNVTVAKLLEKADVLASVFYNRYEDMNELFEKIVREYDYFFNDLIKFDAANSKPLQNYENLFFALIDSLEKKKVMKELLVWEISNNNYITRRTANSRELHIRELLGYFNYELKNTGVDVSALTALLAGGIYYLILHRDMSSMCGIDLNQKEGVVRIKKMIRTIVMSVCNEAGQSIGDFGINREDTDEVSEFQMVKIAKSLFKSGINYKAIKKATGLPDNVLLSIIPQRGRKRQVDGVDIMDEINPAAMVPRKRGRPKKVKTIAGPVNLQEEESPKITTGRKRGRPRKIVV